MMNDTTKFSFFVYKMFVSRAKRRESTKHLLCDTKYSSLQRILEIKKMHSRLMKGKFLFMKTLTETYAFRKRRRSCMWWENVKRKFTYIQWLKYFRMGKETFNMIVQKLNFFLNCKKYPAVSPEKQIALTLISMSSGRSNKCVGRLFSVSEIDVPLIIENVCEAIKTLMPQYLKVPEPHIIKENIEEFQAKWGFPQCAGVLGSIHIPLRTSNLPENASDYINSNNGYSMLLQGVVDASYKFWDINVGWPGSVPESRVFTNSALWLKGQDRSLFPDNTKQLCGIDVPVFILAGSSYPLSHWVLRPFLTEPVTKQEQIFNEKFAFTYNASEIAFKRLKARWNCLVIGNICSIEVFPSVIAASCILHNICEIHKEVIFNEWIVKAENHYKQPIPFLCNTVIGPQAENIRQALKEYFVTSTT